MTKFQGLIDVHFGRLTCNVGDSDRSNGTIELTRVFRAQRSSRTISSTDINTIQSYQIPTPTESSQSSATMWTPVVTVVFALASSVAATVRGGQCCDDGLQHCFNQGAWGCVQLTGPNCVDQTQVCDEACGYSGYAYQKDKYVLRSIDSYRQETNDNAARMTDSVFAATMMLASLAAGARSLF